MVVPSGDYLGHPFPQRQNQIFERLHDGKNFEIHMASFKLFQRSNLKTRLIMHEMNGRKIKGVASYYLLNSANHTLRIRQIIKEEGIDAIILSNLATPFAYTLIDQVSKSHIPILFDLPDHFPSAAASHVFEARISPAKLLEGMFESILGYIMRRATVVTVASNALGRYAENAGAHRVEYVPNGIAECFLRLHDGNALREKLGYGKEDIVVGYIGSLEFWLDVRSLIEGFALTKRVIPSLKLLIVGSSLYTNYAEKVMNWVKQENIEKDTKLIGFVPYELVPEYISALDLGIIPFDVNNPIAHYSSPMKMWEYLSQRKPVLSTPIPEILDNSDCFLTALTSKDYAKQFLLIAGKSAAVNKKMERGYQKALDRTWANSAQLLGSIIRSTLNQV